MTRPGRVLDGTKDPVWAHLERGHSDMKCRPPGRSRLYKPYDARTLFRHHGAHLARFLDRSLFITGEGIVVDGGRAGSWVRSRRAFPVAALVSHVQVTLLLERESHIDAEVDPAEGNPAGSQPDPIGSEPAGATLWGGRPLQKAVAAPVEAVSEVRVGRVREVAQFLTMLLT